MLEGRVQRTRAAGEDVRGQASETKTSPRSAWRGPAPLTAPRSCEHRRSAAEVRAQGPPGSPPAAAARAHLRAVSLPIWEPRARGQSGRVRRGRRRAAGGDAPRGSAGTPRRRSVPPSSPLYPGPPSSAAPLRPPHKFSRAAPRRAPPLARFSSAGPAAVPHRAAGSPGAASAVGPRPVPPAAASCAPRRHRLRRHPRRSSSSSSFAVAAAFSSLQPRPKPIPPPPGPAGRRLRTTRCDGGGGVPPRPGSGGRAARGTRMGGGVPERAGGGASL